MVEVVECCFALKSQFLKHLQDTERKDHFGAIKSCWEPTNSKQLVPSVHKTVASTIAEIHRHKVHTADIKNDEIGCCWNGAGTTSTPMAQLYAQAKIPEV
jgi:hypothetical protein